MDNCFGIIALFVIFGLIVPMIAIFIFGSSVTMAWITSVVCFILLIAWALIRKPEKNK